MKHLKELCAFFIVGTMVLAAFPAMTGTGTSEAGTAPSSRAGKNGDIENNDNMLNATELDGTVLSFQGSISGTDIWDWYKYNLTNTAGNADWWNITLDFDPMDGTGKTEVGMSARILDPFGFVLDFKRDKSKTFLNIVGGFAGTHLYYLNITNDMGESQPTPIKYWLNITKGTLTTTDNDNSPNDATFINTFPYEKDDSMDGSEGPTDYQDFYKTTVSATTTLRDLLIVFVKPSNENLALRAEIFRENGPNWDPVDKVYEDPAMPGKNQTVTYAATAMSTLLIRVRNTQTALGNYHIFINRIPVTTSDCNYSNATALTFDAGSTHTGTGSGGVAEGIHSCDWFKFTAKKDQYMYVNLTSKDYSINTSLPEIIVSLFGSDPTIPEYEYRYELGDHPKMNPKGHVSGFAFEDNRLNYIRVEIMKGGGAGAYNFSFMTDNRPVNNTSLVAPINIQENGQDASIKLKKVFSDPDGDPIAIDWWLESDQGMNDTKNFTVTVAGDADMTVTLKPRAGNATNPFGWKGSGTFYARATDNYGLNDTIAWAILVIGENHEPQLVDPVIAPVLLKSDSDNPKDKQNDTIDLDGYFTDVDNEKLHYTVEGEGVNLTYKKTLGTTYLANAMINASDVQILTVSFGLETNGWQHSGRIYIMMADTAGDWTGEITITIYALDGAQEKSMEGLNLSIRITKKEGTGPKWQTFDLKWYEDSLLVKDFIGEKLVTDVDMPEDKLAISFVPAAPGNITIEQLPGECDGVTTCKFKFTSAPNWYGDVPIVINATDSFNKTSETTDMKLVVMPVDDAPVLNKTVPATRQNTLNEGSTLDFLVDVIDVDTAQGDLRYEWKFDGEVLRTVTGPDYTWTPGPQNARAQPYNISVKVSYAGWNGNLSTSWDVTVLNVNMPPTVGRILKPEENQTFEAGELIDLVCADGNDLDGDALTYTWYVDDGEVPHKGTSVTFDTGGLEEGNHTVKLVVSDGVNPGVSTTASINITKPPKKNGPGFEAPLAMGALLSAAVVAVLVAMGRRKRT